MPEANSKTRVFSSGIVVGGRAEAGRLAISVLEPIGGDFGLLVEQVAPDGLFGFALPKDERIIYFTQASTEIDIWLSEIQ